jgi:hypothetical protein
VTALSRPLKTPTPRRQNRQGVGYSQRLSQTVARLRLSDSRHLRTLVTVTTQGITSFH